MKMWLVPVTVGAFVAGAAAGASTRPKPGPTPLKLVAMTSNPAPEIVPPPAMQPVDEEESEESLDERVVASLLKDGTSPSSRLALFRRLALRLPQPPMVRALWGPVWNSEELERAVYESSRKIEDPAVLAALLYVLDNIQNKDLRSEVVNEVHTSESPIRRRFLAGVLGAPYQEPEFLDEAVALLEAEDPEVVIGALSSLNVGRFRDRELREKGVRLIRQAAGADRTTEVRAAALEALSSSVDPADLRFLLDVLAAEKDPKCRASAVRAIYHFEFTSGDGSLVADAARALWRIWSNPTELQEARRYAGWGIVNAFSAPSATSILGESEWNLMLSKVKAE